jgi:hypothetical protein
MNARGLQTILVVCGTTISSQQRLDGLHVWDKPGLSGYLVCLVHLVSLMQPNKPDRPNRPNEPDGLAGFFSILLKQRLLLPKPFHLTHQFLHAILQTGVVEPKQIQAIQELLPLNLRPLQRSFQPLQLKLDLLLFVSRECHLSSA